MNQKTLRIYPTSWRPPVNIGDEVVLIERHDDNTGKSTWDIVSDPDGVSGNSDPEIKRYHGWRGTTNNVGIYAHGLRRVIRAIYDDDGYASYQRVTVGRDIHPDWE